MTLGSSTENKQVRHGIALCQFALIIFSMAMLAFAPREGEPVALLPLNGEAHRSVAALASATGSNILARGNVDGALVIGGPHPGFIQTLIGKNVLVLNASAPGCGTNSGRAP